MKLNRRTGRDTKDGDLAGFVKRQKATAEAAASPAAVSPAAVICSAVDIQKPKAM